MPSNKQQIKSILEQYVDIDGNYKQIRKRMDRSNQRKKYLKRTLAVSCLFLLVITIFLSLHTNSINNLNSNPIDEPSKRDNIMINKIEIQDDSSTIRSYKSKYDNLMDKFSIFRYFDDLEIFEIQKEQVLYDDSNEIYLGSYSYTDDSTKFLHLYLSNISLFDSLFQECKLSTIDNSNLYIVDYDGVIFIKFINTNQKIILQTNITDKQTIMDIAKIVIQYEG